MNIYQMIGRNVATADAAALADRLTAWHDAMVTHERLRANRNQPCDDECAHHEAQALWREALVTFGPRAQELRFLRSRAGQSVAVAGGLR